MAKSFNIKKTEEYVLKNDRDLPEEQKSKFHIGYIDSQLLAFIEDKKASWSVNNAGSDERGNVSVNTGSRNFLLVRFGLKGWDNYTNDDNELNKFDTVSVPFAFGPKNGLSLNCMDMVRGYISELADEIDKLNNWTSDKQTNF
jgi:hypothetical protein